ncbi:integrin beta-PS-like [Bradysia coprophila]|uniref:integrin beta-PS-like n=1 Tax=Bradysia coprophila TaxID=38358 RepID=UPI00187D7558|nr:integrin beta-PS-like [Bradysia coprophila]
MISWFNICAMLMLVTKITRPLITGEWNGNHYPAGICRPDNVTLIECNGRGTCVDGICECSRQADQNEIIYGKYCECDNFSCPRHNHLLCSGAYHGLCDCGICECQPGWIGEACDCRNSTETCMRHGKVCSDHGTCECGACRCSVTEEGRFSGRYCEKCPTCAGLCHELKDCVQCQTYNTGPLAASGLCAKSCTKLDATRYDTIEVHEENDMHLCTFYDEDDCRFQFVYHDDYEHRSTGFAVVMVQKDRHCPSFIKSHWLLILSVVTGVLVIAVAMFLLRNFFRRRSNASNIS